MTYKYKTKPFPHQHEAFCQTGNLPGYALFWEQGLGKTRTLIDTASHLYLEGKINTLIVVAPNGVHRNWVTDEIPIHMPDAVRAKCKFLIWKSATFDTKKSASERKAIMTWEGLAVVVVAYEATITKKFKPWIKRLVDKRKALIVLDESHRIKTASSTVKITLVALGAHAPYRRIATGTPLEMPFDVYSQVRFLDPTFWKRHGFPTLEDYKQHFGVFIEQRFGTRSFEKVVGYKNLDQLAELVKKIGTRLTKETAGLQLPPKIYMKRYCELTPTQRKAYNELKTEGTTILHEGSELSTMSPMTKMLRLQQIACGFVSCAAEQPTVRVDPKSNPRMDLAVDEILNDLPHQAIIFHRFRQDLLDMMERLGDKAVAYYGDVKDDQRARNKLAFQKGDVQFFVASKAASTGLTFVGAKTCMYYSNSFVLIDRLQSEDRCVLAGTPVRTEHGYKPIEHVQIGERVYSGRGRLCRVQDTWKNTEKRTAVSVRVEDWYAPLLTTTHDHLWQRPSEEWVPADQLHAGDTVLCPLLPAGKTTVIETQKAYGFTSTWHDLTIEDDASFLIGPCSVHNCHRIGQDQSVNYIDVIAQSTIDEYIVDKLRKKMEVFTEILQDDIKPWL